MKKAFTLFEIMVVVLLISILYYFAFINLNVNGIKTQEGVTLNNLKEELLKIEFSDSLSLKCVDEGELCFVFIDGETQPSSEIKELFKQKPEIYTYAKNPDRVFFKRLELEDLVDYDICFEYKIDKYRKGSDIIVDTLEDGIYIFNSIYPKPIKVKYLNEVDDYFEELTKKVKDAF